VEFGIDTMSIPHTKRSSGFSIDSVHVPDMYNLVCKLCHSIIVECSKGKQTYLHSLSLKNQILRYVHPITYNNIYFLTLCGKGIAII
jgi:hypothetical protein